MTNVDFNNSKRIAVHQPCKNPGCNSSDAATIFENEDGSHHAYCFSCQSFYWLKDDYELLTTNKKHESIMTTIMSLQDVKRNSVIAEIPDREISKEICKRYNVTVSYDTQTGDITHHYYPYYKGSELVGYKVRHIPKDFYTVGDVKQADLFGLNLIGDSGKMVIITEGEIDALAASEIFKRRGKNYRIIALPSAAGASTVKRNLERLMKFDNIILCLDQDDVGQEAAKKISVLFPPGRVKVMKFSEKDAGDMLLRGKEMEFINSLFNAQTFRPDGIVTVDDIFEEAIKPVEWGYTWPWETLTRATYGYRRGELYGIGGASGSGKTEFLKEFINHSIEVHKNPVGVFFLEEPVAKTLKVLAGKKFNKRFHIPDGDWTIDELTSGINDLRGKIYLYNHFGAKNWDAIKDKIRYMVVSLGIKDIVLDHLTALVAQEDNEYKALNRIMEEMASLAEELNFTLIYVSHLRKSSGTAHEEGGRVHADDFKGSGAIVYWSHFLFGIERNQQAEDEDERNTSLLRVLKDRYTGLGIGIRFNLFYEHKTGRWVEVKEENIEDIL